MSQYQKPLPTVQGRQYATYPPVANYKILGYLKDQNREGYSRDIGRSFELGGRIYYLFGDTFCKKYGEFVGLQNNTYALLLDKTSPTEPKYLEFKADGLVEPLVPFILKEIDLIKEKKCDRVTLWGFGGIVEISKGVGLHWYQKGIIYLNEKQSYEGVGLARIYANRDTGRLTTYRFPGMLFGPDEPKIGSFTCLKVDNFLYLYGDYENEVILARVPYFLAEHRVMYRFWDGKDWVKDWQGAVRMFRNIPQGAIIRSDLFGPSRPWIFLGCSRWADSKIYVGALKELYGPWELTPVAVASGIDYQREWMYCIYPHVWSLDMMKPEMLVTWSEHWPGGVVAARMEFATAETYEDGYTSGTRPHSVEGVVAAFMEIRDGIKGLIRWKSS